MLDMEWREVPPNAPTAMAGAQVARISALASVAPWVVFGEGVVIHPFALVGHLPSRSKALAHPSNPQTWMRLGDRVEVGPHTTLYGGIVVGDDTLIGDGVSIREDVRIGARCIIGRNVTINFGAVIGDDTRIMDGSFVAEGARIGDGCLLGAGVVMSGDKWPDLERYKYVSSHAPIIDDAVLIGSGANLLPGIRIGTGAVVGAGAIVAESVPPGYKAIGPKATVAWIEPKKKMPYVLPLSEKPLEHHRV